MYWTVHLEGGPRRVNHAAVTVGDLIFSFGGYCTGENYAVRRDIDVHVLDTVSLRWKLIPYHSTTSDPNNTDVPYQRYGHTVVAYGHLIYLWGGRNDTCACNTLYVFDTIQRRWLPRPKVSGYIPGARDGHTACVINKSMLIFGGYEEETDRFSHDVYVLNLDTFEWNFLSFRGHPPPWRDFHSAVSLGDRMYVFGGRSDINGPYHTQQEVYYNEIMYLDTKTCTWVKPLVKGELPMGRRSHSSFVFKDKIYIFGGYNGSINTHFNDLFQFDPETNTWTLVETRGRNKPCPRRRQCCCVVGDRLFLFGGTSPYLNTSLVNLNHPWTNHDMGLMDHSDLFVLDFAPTLKTLSIMVALERKLIQNYLPKDIKMEIAIMTTNNCISRISPSTG